jgi:hypothetical protein
LLEKLFEVYYILTNNKTDSHPAASLPGIQLDVHDESVQYKSKWYQKILVGLIKSNSILKVLSIVQLALPIDFRHKSVFKKQFEVSHAWNCFQLYV